MTELLIAAAFGYALAKYGIPGIKAGFAKVKDALKKASELFTWLG